MTITSCIPVLAWLVSLLAVVPIILSSRRPNIREFWTILAGLIKFGLVLSMLPIVLDGNTVEFTLWRILPQLSIQFKVDAMGMLFALVASLLWIATSIYSIGYMRKLKEHSQTRFYAFFAVSLSATIGVAFAANLLTLYLFYEMLSLSTYPLVAHHQDGSARGGSRTYLSYLLGTSVGFALPAMMYIFWKSGGNMEFAEGGFLAGNINDSEALILLLLLVFGFSKAALMPFHSWLPAAMVAPTPVSALLHAVAVVKVGVFCVLRIFTGVFGISYLKDLGIGDVILWIAAITILVGSLIALSQDNLKRRLAFSTISQLAYIVLGASLLTYKGLTGAMMHIGMHAFGKITLFFCAGAILLATGKKSVSEMAGIGRRMPYTMSAFLLGALSIIGLPPLGGAWSKWYLILGAWESEHVLIVIVLLASSLLNIAYLLPIVVRAFFMVPTDLEDVGGIREAPLACVVPLLFTALASFALFLFPDIFFELADMIGGNL